MLVELKKIKPNKKFLLRNLNTETAEFAGLKESIKLKGFLSSIIVREQSDSNGDPFYEIIDGYHRWEAARQLGIKRISIDIQDIPDDKVEEVQIIMNLHRVPTNNIEFANQLRRILDKNKEWTLTDLAGTIGYSIGWVSERLNLTNIKDKEIISLVDSGKISATNAVTLSKLPPEYQENYIEEAITKKVQEFNELINPIVRNLKDKKKHGKEKKPTEFTPRIHLRNRKEIENAIKDKKFIKAYVVGKTTQESFEAGLKWVLHLDPESQEDQRKRYEDQLKDLEELDEKRRKNREEERSRRLQVEVELQDE